VCEEMRKSGLRALPFAVRCKECEEAREVASSAHVTLPHGVAAPTCSSTCKIRRPAKGFAGGGARSLPPPASLAHL